MKTALINPPWTHPSDPLLWGVRAGSRWPHFQRRAAPGQLPRYIPFPFFLALAAAGAARQGHEVLLLDAVAADLTAEACMQKLRDFAPAFVFCETSTPSLKSDLAFLAELRRQLPSIRIACGGTHPPSLAREWVKTPQGPDIWIAGEYEDSVVAVIQALAEERAIEGIRGVLSSQSKQEALKLAVVTDLDQLPAPLYNQLPMRAYSDPVCGLPAPVAQTWLSRGCPFGCTFCVWPQLIYGQRQYRVRKMDTALDEVERLIQQYGCESFYFDDDTANMGEERMVRLAESIKQRQLNRWPWSMMARADCMTPTMIKALAEAGLYSIKYGVESASPKLLNACNKGTQLEKMKRAIQLTHDQGVKIHLTFTFGLPGETGDTIRETMDFLMQVKPETAQFSICTPFPGTQYYDECKRNGWLISDDWSHYLGSADAVVETPWLSARQLERAYAEAVQEWNRYVGQRLTERQTRLLERLRAAIQGGGRWNFLGDRDAARFIWDQGHADLIPWLAPESDPGSDSVTVIVSRHDEEKLWRRRQRNNPAAAARDIRLY